MAVEVDCVVAKVCVVVWQGRHRDKQVTLACSPDSTYGELCPDTTSHSCDKSFLMAQTGFCGR